MEGVKFDEPQGYQTHYPQNQKKTSKIAGFLIKKGIAKTEAQANGILILIAVICIALAVVLPNLLGEKVRNEYIPPEKDDTLLI